MLEFELIENNDEFVSYRYFPEGKTNSGTVVVNKNNSSVIKEDIAESDEFKTYFFHMLNQIKTFIKNNKYKEKGIIAWY